MGSLFFLLVSALLILLLSNYKVIAKEVVAASFKFFPARGGNQKYLTILSRVFVVLVLVVSLFFSCVLAIIELVGRQ
jgi:hypothetical protein